MRILVHGQALWAKSAYSHQIRMLLDVLISQGHTVGQASTFGFQGRKIQLGDVTLYPQLRDVNGQDVIQAHAENFAADYVISLGDLFMFDPKIWQGMPWVAWATVDSTPLWSGIHEALKVCRHPVAYSQYGQRMMQKEGFENAAYIPLAFDPAVYYPMPLIEARQACQLPGDRFIVGIVQANRQLDNRKNWFGQIEAFRKFQQRRPDAFLYLHTCMSALRGGFNLEQFCTELGMVAGRDYAATDEYTETTIGAGDEQMRALYNAFDVLLQATKAEGFGVPALEASACRKPVIYTDYAALPEAVHYGYRVGGELEWQPAGSWYMRPHQAEIIDALERAYTSAPYDLNRGAPTAYRIDRVGADHWAPYLATLPQAVPA